MRTTILMDKKSILGILSGRKRMTSRLTGLSKINEDPDAWELTEIWSELKGDSGTCICARLRDMTVNEVESYTKVDFPYALDRPVAVRETWELLSGAWAPDDSSLICKIKYRAGYLRDKPAYGVIKVTGARAENLRVLDMPGVKPGIHMPAEFARVKLGIGVVGLERLGDFEFIDYLLEGLPQNLRTDPEGSRDWFRARWDGINADKCPYSDNPWVWKIRFQAHNIPVTY